MIERGIWLGFGGFVKKFNREFGRWGFNWIFQWVCQYLFHTTSQSLFLQHVVGYIRNFFCLTLSISRYPLSKRRYIAIIADIFRVMVDLFE
ncbi:hypothetical protein BAU22_10650 [Bacillus sp. 4048]|nr:hypothetical protein TU50_16320 [Bacillus wiedmannii]KXY01265.1 hypothetical protein AT260_02640 [Bacillus wiedmannii]OAK22601.1 hypothetical protein A6282_25940 [Bacillus wiedmannii]OAK44744.1 hypothetical protein A6285_21350 [Bacillus wiedmannii]OJD49200.1 hypothetical protein BAU22_10650 [Bacillus sp. 4048]